MNAEKQYRKMPLRPISSKGNPVGFTDNRIQWTKQAKMIESIQRGKDPARCIEPVKSFDTPIQRKIIVDGEQGYIDKVENNLDRLLNSNWEGILRESSPARLSLVIDSRYSPQDFINISAGSVSAELVRRRIASVGEDPLGGIADTRIHDTTSSSAFDFGENGIAVMWNSEEKMICYTAEGFQLCSPDILLAHEMGHADAFYTNQTQYDTGTYEVEGTDFSALKEEIRNVGLDGGANPLSENQIRRQNRIAPRLLYNKLINWWVKDNKLTMELCGDRDVLNFYRKRLNVQNIISLIYKASPDLKYLKIDNYIELFLTLKKEGSQMFVNMENRSFTNQDITFGGA